MLFIQTLFSTCLAQDLNLEPVPLEGTVSANWTSKAWLGDRIPFLPPNKCWRGLGFEPSYLLFNRQSLFPMSYFSSVVFSHLATHSVVSQFKSGDGLPLPQGTMREVPARFELAPSFAGFTTTLIYQGCRPLKLPARL